MKDSKPLMLGILGAANIARQFTRDVSESDLVKIAAVASRSAENANKFASENSIPVGYGSYEELLADPAIDAIYLPLPNSMHAEWSIKAAAAGKHVLCEKPLAISSAEAQAMFDAAKRSGTVLIESYPYWFQPHFAALKELLTSGAIGEIRSVQASFGFTVGNPTTNIRLKPELGGGALLDAGSYPLSLIDAVMGTRPTRVVASSTRTESGVDMSTMAMLEYSDGRRAQMSCAMDGATHRHATIVGSQGTLYTEYLNHTSKVVGGNTFGYLPNMMWQRRGVAQTLPFECIQTSVGSGFRFAAEYFARVIQGNEARSGVTEMARASVDIAATLEAISQSASAGQPVNLLPQGA